MGERKRIMKTSNLENILKVRQRLRSKMVNYSNTCLYGNVLRLIRCRIANF